MPMTQTQLADAVAEKAGLSRADAKKAISALEEVILDQIGNAVEQRGTVRGQHGRHDRQCGILRSAHPDAAAQRPGRGHGACPDADDERLLRKGMT